MHEVHGWMGVGIKYILILVAVLGMVGLVFAFRPPNFGLTMQSKDIVVGFTDPNFNKAVVFWSMQFADGTPATNGIDPVVVDFSDATNNGLIHLDTANEPLYVNSFSDGTNNHYQLDGIADYIETEQVDVLQGSTQFTLTGWFHSDTSFNSFEGLMVNFTPSPSGATGALVRAQGSGNRLEFRLNSSGGPSGDLYTNTVTFSLQTWHQVVAKWRGSDGQMVLYLDGVEIERLATSPATGAMDNMNRTWEIGHDPESAGRYWDGRFTRIVFYDGLYMSGSDVLDLFDNTHPVTGTEVLP